MSRARALIVLMGTTLVLSACSDYENARRSFERGDYDAARKQFHALSSKGDAKAAFDLAHMYFSGVGVPVSHSDGWTHLLASANGGHPDAMVELAMRYASGMGTQQSLILASLWYRRAAHLGDSMAAFNLASMYEAGTEIAKDPLYAYAWYVIALKNGNMAARERADELRSKMLREDVERANFLVQKLTADPEA